MNMRSATALGKSAFLLCLAFYLSLLTGCASNWQTVNVERPRYIALCKQLSAEITPLKTDTQNAKGHYLVVPDFNKIYFKISEEQDCPVTIKQVGKNLFGQYKSRYIKDQTRTYTYPYEHYVGDYRVFIDAEEQPSESFYFKHEFDESYKRHSFNLKHGLSELDKAPKSVQIEIQHEGASLTFDISDQYLARFTNDKIISKSEELLAAGNTSLKRHLSEVNKLDQWYRRAVAYNRAYLITKQYPKAAELASKWRLARDSETEKEALVEAASSTFYKLLRRDHYKLAEQVGSNLAGHNNSNNFKDALFELRLKLGMFNKAQALIGANDTYKKRQLLIARDAKLPAATRKEKYLNALARTLKQKNWDTAVFYCQQLRSLKLSLPKAIDFFQGKALLEQGQNVTADRYLNAYIKHGKGARYYHQTINLLDQASRL